MFACEKVAAIFELINMLCVELFKDSSYFFVDHMAEKSEINFEKAIVYEVKMGVNEVDIRKLLSLETVFVQVGDHLSYNPAVLITKYQHLR